MAKRIEEELDAQGMSRTELSKRSGVSAKAVYYILLGNARVRQRTLEKIVGAFGRDITSFFTDPTGTIGTAEREYANSPGGISCRDRGTEERLLALEGDVADLKAACAAIKDDLSEMKTIMMRVLAGGGRGSGQGGGADHNEVETVRKAG